jgi:putative transposase
MAPSGLPLVLVLEITTGRPPIPAERRQLIREMAMNNSSQGEKRIANEMPLKLGIRV